MDETQDEKPIIEKQVYSLKREDISLLISSLAFLVSFTSAVISGFLLYTNRQSMQISQRAYVDVRNARVHVGPLITVPGGFYLRRVDCSMKLKNNGNTPAKFIRLSAKMFRPEGWAVRDNDPNNQRPVTIAPKDDSNWTFSEMVQLTPEAAAKYATEVEKTKNYLEQRRTQLLVSADAQPRPFVQFDFELVYQDVFGEKETLKWRASEEL